MAEQTTGSAGPAQTGILLLNLGGPDSLESVEPFLRNLFSDREIIKLSPFPFLQGFIARRIAASRAPKVGPRYEEIGGSSPILKLTVEQATALQKKLGSAVGDVRVYVGMRYWHPFIADAVDQMIADGVTRMVVLPLYPHYSRATTGSCFAEVNKALGRLDRDGTVETIFINEWYQDPGYIAALAETIREGLSTFHVASPDGGSPSDPVDILFSAHALPQDFIDQGDPYKDHTEATIAAVMARLADSAPPGAELPEIRHHLAFQSRSGPVKWMEPGTDDFIEELAARGCKRLLVVPISFVSDHIETLFEIDMMYRELAVSKGITEYHRSPSLNSGDLFITALADMVRGHLPPLEPGSREAAIAAAMQTITGVSEEGPS